MKLKISALIVIFAASLLYAHPHVYIDSFVNVVCDEDGISCISLRWEFDDMFSQSVIGDYDKNQDGFFDDRELKVLYSDAFINLKNYEYFTHIKINGKKYKIDHVNNFKAEINEGILYYDFDIPLNIKLNTINKKINLSVYDSSYFCDVSPITRKSVSIMNAENINYTISISENKQDAFYYGQITPSELILNLRLKNVK